MFDPDDKNDCFKQFLALQNCDKKDQNSSKVYPFVFNWESVH